MLPEGAAPFDRRTERSFRDGTIRIDARLDLHGMTQAEAHAALTGFLAAQVKAGGRRLLIITGRSGILRQRLKAWVEALPEAAFITDFRSAAPRHGGEGAFYLWLRKKAASG